MKIISYETISWIHPMCPQPAYSRLYEVLLLNGENYWVRISTGAGTIGHLKDLTEIEYLIHVVKELYPSEYLEE